MTVGFAVPSIPPRAVLLQRALDSIAAQTHPVDTVSVVLDVDREGAAATRNRAKNALTTEWTCFLDDDDELYPQHVERLLEHQQETGADLVFPWFDVLGGSDPFPTHEFLPWDDAAPHAFPITVLVRTELAQAHDFPVDPEHASCANEDWRWFKMLLADGAHFAHLYERTWCYRHDSGNLSGLAYRDGKPTW